MMFSLFQGGFWHFRPVHVYNLYYGSEFSRRRRGRLPGQTLARRGKVSHGPLGPVRGLAVLHFGFQVDIIDVE